MGDRYWGGEQNGIQVPMDALDAYQRAEKQEHRIRQMQEELKELYRLIVDLQRENLSLKVKLGMAPDSRAC